MRRHEGKVAVCFGAAGGIGGATVSRLAAGGAKAVISDVNLAAAEAKADSVRALGGEAIAVHCDIGNEAQIAAVIAAAVDTYGGVDLLHQNAAATNFETGDSDMIGSDLSIFDEIISANLRGSLICVRHAIPVMLERGGGAIVFTSTDGVYTLAAHQYFYRMSKSGVNSLMRSIAVRYGKQGIRSNAVSPGLILKDDGSHGMTDDVQSAYLDRTFSPRLGVPDDVAGAVDFLLSDDAGWINGQVLSVNGGYVMRQ